MNYLVVLTTASDLEDARRIAHALVEERLAACCNLVDRVESIYRWEGAVVQENEVLVIIKTGEELFERLKERVIELHSYDNPELIALPIVAGSEKYLQWLGVETTGR